VSYTREYPRSRENNATVARTTLFISAPPRPAPTSPTSPTSPTTILFSRLVPGAHDPDPTYLIVSPPSTETFQSPTQDRNPLAPLFRGFSPAFPRPFPGLSPAFPRLSSAARHAINIIRRRGLRGGGDV
jgi:hypothetical protein